MQEIRTGDKSQEYACTVMFRCTTAGVCKHKKSVKGRKKEKCDLVILVLRECICVFMCVRLTDRRLFKGLCQAEFCGQMSPRDAVRSQCDRCPHVKTPTVPLIELVP